MNSVRRLVATLGLSSALLVSSAGIASAQSWSGLDAKGDVLTSVGDSDEVTVVPERTQGDIWRTSISHTPRRVVIRVTMRALPRGDWAAIATIRTPRTSFDVMRGRFGGYGILSLSKTDGDGDEIRCKGKTSRIEGTSIVLSVPRRCIGRPHAVRVGIGLVGIEDEESFFMDDGLRRGVGAEDFQYSPVIRRG